HPLHHEELEDDVASVAGLGCSRVWDTEQMNHTRIGFTHAKRSRTNGRRSLGAQFAIREVSALLDRVSDAKMGFPPKPLGSHTVRHPAFVPDVRTVDIVAGNNFTARSTTGEA